MTTEDWQNKLNELRLKYAFKTRKGIPDVMLSEAETCVGFLPLDLRSFYTTTNGLRLEWLNILPVESKNDIKDTWDGLKRANDVKTTKYLGRSEELLRKFLIFADIGGGNCACFDREKYLIWFQDADGLHEMNLSLLEFLELSLREVTEL